jgi:hypothetical protein
MGWITTQKQRIAGGAFALGLACVAPVALAQEDEVVEGGRAMEMPDGAMLTSDMKISFAGGVDYNTHFISYGFDVWGVGDDFGEDMTLNPWAEVAADFGSFSVVVGTWMDINSNGASPIGGQFQEIDAYYGLSFDVDKFSFGITYQDWVYGGGVEKILDLSVGYDDSELWGGDFALNPSFVAHKRLGSTNIAAATVGGDTGDENGWVLVAGIEPGFTLIDSEDYPIDLSIPVSLGFFLEEGFHGTNAAGTAIADDGFGYFSIGANLSMPLTFIPAEYGAWSAGAGLTYYYTDEDVIPNPDDTFITGTIGISVSF